MEEDIDQILERSAKTIVHSTTDSALSSFSKASFVSDNAEADLNLDDPNFWKKLLPEAATKNPHIIEESRTRKPVQRYEPGISDESEDEMPEQEPDTDYEHTDDPGTRKKASGKIFSPVERQRFKAAVYDMIFSSVSNEF